MCRKSHMHMLNYLTNSTRRSCCTHRGYIERQCEKNITLKRSMIPEKYIIEDPTVTVKLRTAMKAIKALFFNFNLCNIL